MTLSYSALLGERLYFFTRLRFLAAAGILVGALFATYAAGIEGLDLRALTGAAVFLAFVDVGIYVAVRPYRGQPYQMAAHRRLVAIAHISILLDYLVLTFATWLVGGSQSPFLAFYLLHATLSSILLSRRAAVAHAMLGYLLLAGLVLGEWFGVLPKHRPGGAVPGGPEVDFRVVLTVLFVYALLIVVATWLTTGVVRLLRDSDRRLRAAGEKLERLAAMRRSFLHVVLHDVRSPVATVVAMLDGLVGGLDGPLAPAQKDRVDRATGRLRSALELLRGLRILADLETEPLASLMAPVDLVATVRSAVEDHLDSAELRQQSLHAELPATLPPVRCVERLIREALANYLTNAIKYTRVGGSIVVRAATVGTVVRIEVTDNGPGIAAQDQERLFQEFVRVGSGKKTAAAGTGLGLSIVHRIAEAHGGRVGVSSQLGHGSTFFIELPVAG